MPGTQIADLPTPKQCKSGVFEKKKTQKPGVWDLKPGNFQNMCQMRLETQIIFVNVFFTLLDVIYSDYF